MAFFYKTPGVYLNEVQHLPSAVASVATSIPCFLGVTEKAIDDSASTESEKDLKGKPKKITSIFDYEYYFGFSDSVEVSVLVKSNLLATVELSKAYHNTMYYAVKHYFDNGGSLCYIHSVGSYNRTGVDAEAYKSALKKIDLLDEVSLIVLPDLSAIADEAKYYSVYDEAMKIASALKDKFVIIDVINKKSGTKIDIEASKKSLRNTIANNADYNKHAAAYFPNLQTTYSYDFGRAAIKLTFEQSAIDINKAYGLLNNLNYRNVKKLVATNNAFIELEEHLNNEAKETLEKEIVAKYKALIGNNTDISYTDIHTDFLQKISPFLDTNFDAQIKEAFQKIPVILTPSAAIAGVYNTVDSTRGVWKAPANVSLNAVTKPLIELNDLDQGDFTIDAHSGKSINCIRQFVGHGNLVWGARTLAGNDNEWKYVNVCRFFNMVEKSCQKTVQQFVFEPNDANTWVSVRTMINKYLTELWKEGALQGSQPDHAFYVSVGLGDTMTANDILEGNLIVLIGLAIVRPAEFITMRFAQKLAGA